MSLTNHIIHCIDLADNKKSKITEEIANWYDGNMYEGMSSPKVRHLLNNLMDKQVASQNNVDVIKYLEVGSFKGSTAIPALYENNDIDKYWLIDNHSQFNIEPWGNPNESLLRNFELFLNATPNLILNESFSVDFIQHNITDVNVYFYDGEHSPASQKLAITYYIDVMADEFVFIVDDYDGAGVQQGTTEGLNELIGQNKIEILYSRHLSTYPESTYDDPEKWYGGIYIAAIKKLK